jgi:hypothetical protein
MRRGKQLADLSSVRVMRCVNQRQVTRDVEARDSRSGGKISAPETATVE